MAEDKLGKNDIAAVFKRLRGIPANKVCFDCGAKNPTWASVTYGVFICIDCSAVHRSLGVHLSFVRSTQLDTWTWLQLRAMQVGGNANALSFFHQHGCTSTDSQQKYSSRVAQMYREKLHQQATAAIRLHGTKLHIELPHAESSNSPQQKEVDFFEDIAEAHISTPSSDTLQNGSPNFNNNKNNNFSKEESLLCPKVESALNISPSEGHIKTDTRKSTITGRKPANKKTLGGRTGLGAQKVTTNFTDIEKEAQRIDELRQQADSVVDVKSEKSQEDEDLQKAAMRLAYKHITQRQKEAENKMRDLDPRKAEQMERLGIGFGANSNRNTNTISHSVASEMKLITQENVATPVKFSDLDHEDDFEFFNFISGPPKYGDSPFLTRSASDRLGDISGKNSWTSERKDRKSTSEIMPSSQKDSSGRSRKFAPVPAPSTSDEAQKKFGNARAISSEQYFGPNRDLDFERRTNLTRFEGSSSISSEDYFGGNSSVPRSASASSFSGPNLYEIKEGVRDGVTKVAGRLSSLANGMMNSLQDRYGI